MILVAICYVIGGLIICVIGYFKVFRISLQNYRYRQCLKRNYQPNKLANSVRHTNIYYLLFGKSNHHLSNAVNFSTNALCCISFTLVIYYFVFAFHLHSRLGGHRYGRQYGSGLCHRCFVGQHGLQSNTGLSRYRQSKRCCREDTENKPVSEGSGHAGAQMPLAVECSFVW